ncbi:uncharacterized protein LOC107868084 isoform X2 [Capsicum annuum]|uniref:uncharacterized protein LOC107868084 isoform X2 n=1 Tax=Capsicum annuum TaxID=4072 RepID=UPI001FB075DB|nr:uncharacterized protein LOC107868084 isoform X2 [Capsicum annuum]
MAFCQSTSLRDFFTFLGSIWDMKVEKGHKVSCLCPCLHPCFQGRGQILKRVGLLFLEKKVGCYFSTIACLFLFKLGQTKEKDLGRKPTQLEVFKQTYVKKNMNESDPDVWVETRAENVNNEYVRYLSEFGSTEPTQEESIKIWTEKVAGGKKGENLCVWFSK